MLIVENMIGPLLNLQPLKYWMQTFMASPYEVICSRGIELIQLTYGRVRLTGV